MLKQLELYAVEADETTGEWIGYPVFLQLVDELAWFKSMDSFDPVFHRDTYEVSVKDEAGLSTGATVTRAILVKWVA